MIGRPKSARDAVDSGLEVQRHQARSSHAPLIQNAEQRNFLATMCSDKVEQARGGNIDAAREILRDFARSVLRQSKRSWRGPNHYVYARYLADAFERILNEGVDPSIALGVKSSKPGRRKGAVTHDSQALAAAYWLLHRKGHRPEACVAKLCELTGADRTTVQSARQARYTKAFSHPELVSDGQLKAKLQSWRHRKEFLKQLASGPVGGRTRRGNKSADSHGG